LWAFWFWDGIVEWVLTEGEAVNNHKKFGKKRRKEEEKN